MNHYYSVFVTFYRSRSLKEQSEARPRYRLGSNEYRTKWFYSGPNHRQMRRAFYRACRAAQRSPLSVSVTVLDGTKPLLELQVARWV